MPLVVFGSDAIFENDEPVTVSCAYRPDATLEVSRVSGAEYMISTAKFCPNPKEEEPYDLPIINITLHDPTDDIEINLAYGYESM